MVKSTKVPKPTKVSKPKAKAKSKCVLCKEKKDSLHDCKICNKKWCKDCEIRCGHCEKISNHACCAKIGTCILCDNDDLRDCCMEKCIKCSKYFHYKNFICNDVTNTGKCKECEQFFCGSEDNGCDKWICKFSDEETGEGDYTVVICRYCADNKKIWKFMIDEDYGDFMSAKEAFEQKIKLPV